MFSYCFAFTAVIQPQEVGLDIKALGMYHDHNKMDNNTTNKGNNKKNTFQLMMSWVRA